LAMPLRGLSTAPFVNLLRNLFSLLEKETIYLIVHWCS